MSSQSLVNKESSLLGSEDNSTLFSIIGAKCISLSTAVIQLYLTKAPNHNCWLKKSAGVLCLIRDSSHRSYYFRVYCLQRKCLVWEQELYDIIDYKTHCDFFHYFEAEDCLCAFNFANSDEAADFKKAVDNKLELRKQNKAVNRHRKSKEVHSVASVPNSLVRNESNVSNQLSIHSANVSSGSSTNINNNSLSSSFSNLSKFSKTFGAKKKKKRLSKNEISQPSNFQHLSYVKLTNDGSINTNMNSPELQAFFDKAGVSQQQLNDTKTRKFIYEFIDKYGGLDAVKKDISEDNLLEPKNQISGAQSTECNDVKIVETAPPPVPARNFQTKNVANNRPLPPSPNRTLKNANKKPIRNGGVLPQQLPPPPPPPPPPSTSSSTMTTISINAPSTLSSSNTTKPTLTIAPNPRTKSDTKSTLISSSSTSMPAPVSSIPPPPPPPLPPPMPEMCLFEKTPSHQPIETNTSDNNSVIKTDLRSALLESIKSGITLNHVEPVKKTLDSPRSNLLLEIRQGVELKSVTPPSSDKKPIRNDDNSMAAVLARALAERARLMNPDTDSSSSSSRDDDDDDDDEWDD